MTKSNRVTQEQVKKIKAQLIKYPVKDTSMNARDAIKELAKDFEAYLAKGYTLKDACNVLQEQGLEVTPSTLKAYLQKAKSTVKRTNTNSFVKPDTPVDDL